MRYLDIISEKRRNAPLNPKTTTYDELERYAGQNVFVSFTADVGALSNAKRGIDPEDAKNLTKAGFRARGAMKNVSGFKLGINPLSHYDTPIGIYAYPLSLVIEDGVESLPFAATQPFAIVFRARGKVVNMATYSEADFERDVTRLRKHPSFSQEDFDYAVKTAKSKKAIARLWNVTRLMASASPGKAAVQWNAILRSLGYAGFVDDGFGLIHENEPTQAVFLSISSVEIVDVVSNRPEPRATPSRETIWVKNPKQLVRDLVNRAVSHEAFLNFLFQRPHVVVDFKTIPEKILHELARFKDVIISKKRMDILFALPGETRFLEIDGVREILPPETIKIVEKGGKLPLQTWKIKSKDMMATKAVILQIVRDHGERAFFEDVARNFMEAHPILARLFSVVPNMRKFFTWNGPRIKFVYEFDGLSDRLVEMMKRSFIHQRTTHFEARGSEEFRVDVADLSDLSFDAPVLDYLRALRNDRLDVFTGRLHEDVVHKILRSKSWLARADAQAKLLSLFDVDIDDLEPLIVMSTRGRALFNRAFVRALGFGESMAVVEKTIRHVLDNLIVIAGGNGRIELASDLMSGEHEVIVPVDFIIDLTEQGLGGRAPRSFDHPEVPNRYHTGWVAQKSKQFWPEPDDERVARVMEFALGMNDIDLFSKLEDPDFVEKVAKALIEIVMAE